LKFKILILKQNIKLYYIYIIFYYNLQPPMKISTAQSRLEKYPKKCEEQIKVSSILIYIYIHL